MTTRVAGYRIAILTAASNAIAGLAMLVVLKGGAPQAEPSLVERVRYVNANTAAWRAGWFTWNLAAVTLLAFYVVLANRWRDRAPVLCRLALMLGAAGLAADLGAEAMLMIGSPGSTPDVFATIERIAFPLTGYLGNGLYTAAGALLTIAGARELPRQLLALAAVVWAFGVALSASTLVGSDGGQYAATAGLVPLFVLWTFAVGRWLRAS